MIRYLCTLFLLTMLSLTAQAGQPTIVTSIHPLALVVKELVADHADVTVLVPANVSPHHYSMRPSERRRLQQADRFVWLGPAKEPFLANSMDDADLKAKSIVLDDDPDEGGGHDHSGEDPHVWLNPDEIRGMLPVLVESLGKLNDLDRSGIERRRDNFLKELAQTEDRIRKRLDALPPMDVFTYHGAFNHFAEHFGVEIEGTLTTNPERNPGARHLAELQRRLNESQAPCIMTEPQFSKDWWDGLEIDSPIGVSHWDPMGSDVEIREGGYNRFLEQLADSLVDCTP